MEKKEVVKTSKLYIYQSVVLIISAVIISLFPSLLIWKFKIMPAAEADVLIGLVFCYIISLVILFFGIFFLIKMKRHH